MRKLISVFLSHTDWGDLLCQPKQTKTARKQVHCGIASARCLGVLAVQDCLELNSLFKIIWALELYEFGVQSMPGLVHGHNFSVSCSLREGGDLLLAHQ